MKKGMIIAALALSMAGMLAGCSQKDPAYLSGIKAEDYVELPDYSSIPAQETEPSVSDEYLDTYIQYVLASNAQNVEVTDRDEVQEGDIANIDYVGRIDGEEFDGGSATDTNLTIGSGRFIDGFEDGLIGAKVGETVTLDLKFPDDYSSEEVAGKDVEFTVTVNKILETQTPELTDEFVAQQGIDGVTTVEEYRTYCYDQLMEQAQASYDSSVQNQIVQWLEDNATFKQDPPEEMVTRYNTTYTENFNAYAQNYGLDLETYMTYMGSSADTYEQDIQDMALRAAKEYIILQAIADREDLNISDSEFNTELSTAAASSGYSSVDDFEEVVDTEAYREYLMVQDVLEFLMDRAVVTEPTEEESSDTAADAATAEESAEAASTEATAEESAEAASTGASAEDAADTGASEAE
ncbi:MAG: trigger factor [Eubacteriales bacterium]|nr:trigger factor [Eubacteriales bacterium]